MAKLKLLSTKGITADQFDGVRSYGAALWAIDICNKLIERANRGDIIFSYENLVKPEFELRWDKDLFLGLYLKDDEDAWVHIVGDMRSDGAPIILDGVVIDMAPGKIHCLKKDIREFFKLWRTAKIVDVTRAIDLV